MGVPPCVWALSRYALLRAPRSCPLRALARSAPGRGAGECAIRARPGARVRRRGFQLPAAVRTTTTFRFAASRSRLVTLLSLYDHNVTKLRASAALRDVVVVPHTRALACERRAGLAPTRAGLAPTGPGLAPTGPGLAPTRADLSRRDGRASRRPHRLTHRPLCLLRLMSDACAIRVSGLHMADDSIRSQIATLVAEARSGRDRASRRLQSACWPGGSADRTEPVAMKWLARWRPARSAGAVPVCQCATGRCPVCN